MDGFRAAFCNAVARRKDEDCSSLPEVDLQYNPSNSDFAENSDSASHSLGKETNVSKELGNLISYCGACTPFYQDSSHIIIDSSISHRASLENDIERLQLQLHEEKSMRMMLEKAIGRTSSTLSPGHGHFAAQTRELIQEIELLEEEVANRERHVLCLYRSILDQHLGRAPSEENSLLTSPVHTKNGARRHPSIISSTFCSSKKFSLQPFQVLSSKKDLGKKSIFPKSKMTQSSVTGGKTDTQIDSNCPDTTKVPGKESTAANSSVACTLKDDLYQCPNKLSEELVRCMATIYCWVCNAATIKLEKSCSPAMSRSSTIGVLPRQRVGDDQDWSSRPSVEISKISTDRNQCPRASYAIGRYRVLVEQLKRVKPSQMETNAKLAFWINVYNSLVMHVKAFLAYGISIRSLMRVALFHKAAYNIGGCIISANSIEHSILCCHTPRIARWFEIILSIAMWRKRSEETQLLDSGFGLSNSQPLVCFALCNGATSDPVLRVYTAANVKEELEMAKSNYLQANVVVTKSEKVSLPRILERYSKEASLSSDDLFSWVCDNVDDKLRDAMRECIDSKSNRNASHVLEWLPYDARFRYVFVRDLTEKPCWL